MTLDEAIKRLRQELAVQLGSGNLSAMIRLGDKKSHAIQLGIEALEAIKHYRANHTIPELYPLPSEFKEVS